MKTILYVNGKKTTKKAVAEKIGEARLERYILGAKAQFWEDPLVENDYMIPDGILTIRFD